jgi:hypothetical protein
MSASTRHWGTKANPSRKSKRFGEIHFPSFWNEMKIISLLLCAFTCCCAKNGTQIIVSGLGQATAVPDAIILSLSLQTAVVSSPKVAFRQGTNSSLRVIRALRQFGYGIKSVESSAFSISTVFNKTVRIGYHYQAQVRIYQCNCFHPASYTLFTLAASHRQ